MAKLAIAQRLEIEAARHGTGLQTFGIRGEYTLTDPFLNADEFYMTAPTFGPHPHAGFSAVTYMFDDAATGFSNRDSLGEAIEIRAGDAHWTVAGAGMMHEEVPVITGKVAHGLQIFVNLAANDKHIAPHSIHLLREAMPRITQAGGAVVKMAFGSYNDGITAHASTIPLPSDVSLFDVTATAGTVFTYPLPVGQNAFALVINGEMQVGTTLIKKGQAVAFGREGGALETKAISDAQFALFIGKPFDEPVVRHGPFAMSNQADIKRAIADFKAGRMGALA
jgi:redox-sensitive bicupin YhaK (pirin superfamily)